MSTFQELLAEEERLTEVFQSRKENFEKRFNNSFSSKGLFSSLSNISNNNDSNENSHLIETATESLLDFLHQRLTSTLTPKNALTEEKTWQSSLKKVLDSFYSVGKPLAVELVMGITYSIVKRFKRK